MEKIVVFLRGVNVKGVKMKMVELQSFFQGLGYKNVETVLATGNIILTTSHLKPLKYYKETLEKALSDFYKYEASIIIRRSHDLKRMVDLMPEISLNQQLYILLSQDNSVNHDLILEYNQLKPLDQENLILLDDHLFWIVKKGDTLKSEFGKIVLGAKRFKSKVTSRNMNTIIKICKKL